MPTPVDIGQSILDLLPRLNRIAKLLVSDADDATAMIGASLTRLIGTLPPPGLPKEPNELFLDMLREFVTVWRTMGAASPASRLGRQAPASQLSMNPALAALEALSPDARCMFILYRLEQLPLEHVAYVMATDVKALEGLVSSI